ncbi:pilin [Patescibacteria group bacterium]
MRNKKQKLYKVIFPLFLFIIIFVFTGALVFADTEVTICTDKDKCFTNPLGEGITAQLLIGQIINTILGIVGSLALVMFIYGGLTWMTASGNNEKIQKGKDILMWAALGLVVIFSAYAMVKFILEALNQG